MAFAATCKNFFLLARLPFVPVGILPFLIGAALARKTGDFDGAVFWLSLLATAMVMVSANINGERYDLEEDRLCRKRTIFSSGSGIALTGTVAPEAISRAATGAALIALLIGAALQFLFKTGPLTVLLGVTGLFSGYFYSKPPLRLVSRGVGELLIGFCYGWLAPVCAFYTQSGYIHPSLNFVALPLACATVNIIWINEILDLPQDTAAGKKCLVVRLGRERAARFYRLFAFTGAASCLFSLSVFDGWPRAYLFVPALVFFALAAALVGRCRVREKVLAACGFTLAAQLSLAAAYLVLLS